MLVNRRAANNGHLNQAAEKHKDAARYGSTLELSQRVL